MTTIRVRLSHALIKQHKDNLSISQIRDNGAPIYFRYSSTDRNTGTFYLVVHKNNKSHWLKLGKYPLLPVKAAREKAFFLDAQIEERGTVSNELQFKTLKELLLWYKNRVSKNISIREHTKNNQISVIKNHLIPRLGDTKVESLSLPTVNNQLFEPLQEHYALSTIDNMLAILNAALERALHVHLIAINPIPKCSLAEFTNQRPHPKSSKFIRPMLSPLLNRMVAWTPKERILVSMLLLHGTRIGETIHAKWKDFDFKEKVWRIPARYTKNKKPHTLPLTDLAITCLKEYKKHQDEKRSSQFLFTNTKNIRKCMSSNAGSRLVSQLADGKWSAHDLRKFARSQWMEIGIDYMVCEFLLNHTLSKLDQAYIQTLAMPNCRKALEKWGDYLQNNGFSN